MISISEVLPLYNTVSFLFPLVVILKESVSFLQCLTVFKMDLSLRSIHGRPQLHRCGSFQRSLGFKPSTLPVLHMYTYSRNGANKNIEQYFLPFFWSCVIFRIKKSKAKNFPIHCKLVPNIAWWFFSVSTWTILRSVYGTCRRRVNLCLTKSIHRVWISKYIENLYHSLWIFIFCDFHLWSPAPVSFSVLFSSNI